MWVNAAKVKINKKINLAKSEFGNERNFDWMYTQNLIVFFLGGGGGMFLENLQEFTNINSFYPTVPIE